MKLGMGFTQLEMDWPSVDTVRIWDIGVDWARVNTAPGVYDWSRLDAVVAKAQATGAGRIVYVHHGVPGWLAQKNPNEHTAPWMPPGSNSVPKDLAKWDAWVRAVVKRYKGRIHIHEIGNEPQLPDFMYPWNQSNRATWAKMTKRAYKIIKEVDPKAKVWSASVLPRKSSGGMKKGGLFLDELKKVGWPVDAVACHIYPTVGENWPEWKAYYDEVVKAAKQRGCTKPVVVTETLFDLLGPEMSDSKGQNLVKKVATKHKGSVVIWYAFNRPDLGGMGGHIRPGTLTWAEMQTHRA